MRFRKALSGGQTGADRTALECAKELGLETGGTAPKHYRTEDGDDLSLKTLFGLEESNSYGYKPRTHKNVKDADVTVWFGKIDSPGYWCTRGGTIKYEREFYVNPSPAQVVYLCNSFETINFAGNRKSKNPPVVQLVRDAFQIIRLRKETPDATG